MNFEIVRSNALASDAGVAPQADNNGCTNVGCPIINVTCNCEDAFCGNDMDCSFVAVGDGCQEVSINSLNP